MNQHPHISEYKLFCKFAPVCENISIVKRYGYFQIKQVTTLIRVEAAVRALKDALKPGKYSVNPNDTQNPKITP